MKKQLYFILISLLTASLLSSCGKGENNQFSEDSGTFTDNRDNNTYKWVKIGTQIWMAENLKATKYADGTSILHITDNAAWSNLGDNNADKAYCFYNNNESLGYGVLYTYAAAVNGTPYDGTNHVQGVCPDGWHVPSDVELTELTDYLGGRSVAGGKLKETGITHWNSPNEGATNESGFTALPGGFRESRLSGLFFDEGNGGYWWSGTENHSTLGWSWILLYRDAEVYWDGGSKSAGFCVRCLKDN